MIYEAPFGELEISVLNLRDAVMGVALAADGAPERHTMSDLVSDASVELQSQANAMVSAVGAVRNSDTALDSREAVLHAVADCQEQYIAMTGVLQDDLMHYERIAELATLGRKKGAGWGRWTHEVLETLDGCRQPLYDVQKALFYCWKTVSAAPFAGCSSLAERGDLNIVGS